MDIASHLDDDHDIKPKSFPLYVKILTYWFPADPYDVCPCWVVPDTSLHGSNNCEDYTISFVITCQRQPLLLLDAGFSSDFQATWARESANRQIIYYLDVVGLTNQHADRLYAISAVGKKWRAMYSMGSHGGRSVKGIAELFEVCDPGVLEFGYHI